ncbi:pilus assembly protein [bacterium]|nr:pilus assembly protein [bacterium]
MFVSKIRTGLTNIFKDEKGQNIVEFALITPILLVLFMGVFDFGWLLHKQIQLDHATREAARRAVVGADNAAAKQIVYDTCSFEVTEDMITIEVQDENGVPVSDPEDRTPDYYYSISVDINDVDFITPLKALVDAIGVVNLHSESVFIIE